MLKKIVKIITLTLLLIVLIPSAIIGGFIIKHRLDYGKTMEKDYIEKLTYYSQAIKNGKTINFEKGALDGEESERIRFLRAGANYDNKKHRLISYEELPPHLVELLILAEDPDFYNRRFGYVGHFVKQMFSSLKGNFIGGSTLEYLVNIMMFEQPREPIESRILNGFFATATVEKTLTKEETLELFLNYHYFDAGIYGVENISYLYFKKSASKLDPAESALIVTQMRGLFYSPLLSSDRCKRTQLALLKKMEASGTLAPGEAERQVELFWQNFDIKSIGKVVQQQ